MYKFIISIMFLMIFMLPAYAKCEDINEFYKILDMDYDNNGVKRELTIVCETSSKIEADNYIKTLNYDSAFVVKDTNIEKYRVITYKTIVTTPVGIDNTWKF